MRKNRITAAVTVLILLSLTLAACGKSEFSVNVNTGKRMVITAENAEKDASFTVGTLEVSEGEQIVIAADLKKGSVRVELGYMPEEQSADKFPDISGDAVVTANVKLDEGAVCTAKSGNYYVRAICLEKATGTVNVEAQPAE